MITEQKFIMSDDESRVQELLDAGWKIVSVTAQHISACGNYYDDMSGKFAIVLEKTKTI